MNKMNEKVKFITLETVLELLEEQINQRNLHSMKEASETLGKLSDSCDSLVNLGTLIDNLPITQEQYNQIKASYEATLNIINQWVLEEMEKSEKVQFQLSMNLNPDIERTHTSGSIQ